MAITFSDNLNLPIPKPTRTTEVVGLGLPTSVYANKEAVPDYMRYLYMETIDETGQKWVLKNPLDIMEWSAVPNSIESPPYDGDFVRRKAPGGDSWVAVSEVTNFIPYGVLVVHKKNGNVGTSMEVGDLAKGIIEDTYIEGWYLGGDITLIASFNTFVEQSSI